MECEFFVLSDRKGVITGEKDVLIYGCWSIKQKNKTAKIQIVQLLIWYHPPLCNDHGYQDGYF